MHLTPSECRRRLQTEPFAVLGTLNERSGTSGAHSNRVHLVPVVFAVIGEVLAVPIDRVKPKRSTRLRRIENLEHDPRGTLLVDHRSSKWSELWWVRADLVFTGTADPTPWMDAFAARYPAYDVSGSIASVLEFTIDSVSGWSAEVG